MRIKFIATAGSVLFLFGAQSGLAKDHGPHKTKAKHHAGYVKPGAAVELSYDYDGKTKPGEFVTITATLSHIYEDGALSVQILSPPELDVSAFTGVQNSPVYKGSILELPIQFSGSVQGVYTIGLEAIYEGPDGQQSRRVLSIPVNIGAGSFEKLSSANSEASDTVSKSGVIGLAAIEVIE